ncbi:hypothetical protein BREU_3003 [Bifidobacterium reuteri DSM 23975]|uniref:Uncharacterized protein n=1 Tax=Bifidobacterium reuteri DSM 23975 TaxID=1437610 RepID=A0A087CMD2_9BIFI|nr:hypothetical protein BREU_3003 [Bifidobacterium reuteri DSM 23975]
MAVLRLQGQLRHENAIGTSEPGRRKRRNTAVFDEPPTSMTGVQAALSAINPSLKRKTCEKPLPGHEIPPL